MEKHCTECGQKLIGRIDKKFCNDQCRTAYHNKRIKKQNPFFWNPSVVYSFIENR